MKKRTVEIVIVILTGIISVLALIFPKGRRK